MALETYVPIESFTISGTSTNEITFGSGNTLPQTFTDLVVVFQGGVTSGSADLLLNFNGDSSSGLYAVTKWYGTGSGTGSTKDFSQNSLTLDNYGYLEANLKVTNIAHIFSYKNTNVHKSVLVKSTSASSGINLNSGVWKNKNAITSIRLYTSTGYFATGSTLTIYGIANASISAPKATGGMITSDSQYWYHAFGSSGTFTPTQSLTADILVVAGGGGGGRIVAGGGGAGGLLGFASQSLSATGYTVTVGAGGAGATGSGYSGGATGGDSQFGALTLVKGGGGNGWVSNGLTGGSGGGASGAGTGYTGGSPTSGQGYAGGNSANQSGGAGGGGAGAVGSNGTNNGSGQNIGGAGGNGLSTYSSWGLVTGTGQNVSGTVYYAGGGGGGGSYANATTPTSGGYGGGGAGGLSNQTTVVDILAAVAGTPNTGGGGGGAGNDFSGANTTTYGKNGGSGVVIVRYPR